LQKDKTDGTESEIFTHNIRSKNPDDWAHEYIENESYRKHTHSDSIKLYHEIVSFSNRETEAISKEMLADIATKYISLRGDTGMYVGAVHRDKEHIHVHLCVSGLAYRTGKAFRLSRSDMQALKKDLQTYHLHRYPSIRHSTCEHGSGKGSYSQREWYAKHSERRGFLKAGIADTVQTCFSKATSLQHFLHLLRDSGLHHYEQRDHVQGIVSEDGMKFRFKRLGIDITSLSLELHEERKALAEIQHLRESRKERAERYPERN
jgi:hypothetical protein